MSAPDLGSQGVPPPASDDHIRGEGPELTVYLDLACPGCAAFWERALEQPFRLCVRHFPITSKRPRAPFLHRAAEAAATLGGETAFWSFWDSLYADRGHTDDPHLWARAEDLGLDVGEFDRFRKGEAVDERVIRDFRSGLRAGAIGTPSVFRDSRLLREDEVADLFGR